jgi:hypothetical protein
MGKHERTSTTLISKTGSAEEEFAVWWWPVLFVIEAGKGAEGRAGQGRRGVAAVGARHSQASGSSTDSGVACIRHGAGERKSVE